MLEASSELFPQVSKILVFGAVVPCQIEVQPRTGLSVKNHATFEGMRVTDFVVDVRSPACQVGKEELSRLDLAENSRRDLLLVLDVIRPNGANVKLLEDLLDRVSNVDELWSRPIHGHHDEGGARAIASRR